MISYTDALNSFNSDVLPGVIAAYSKDDTTAINEAWHNFTDSLCKDSEMTDLAYHYCPSYDDCPQFDDLGDDIESILSDMGVTFSADMVTTRGDGHMTDMKRHFRCELNRGSGLPYEFYFSQGDAHTESPTLVDCLSCLMSDANGVDGTSFEDWCNEYGYDTDSRKAFATYEACQSTAIALSGIFKKGEMTDLHEMFCEAGL